MAIYIFKQGDTQKVEKQVIEVPALDFSDATDIFCILSIGSTIQKRYSLNTRDNYGKLEVDNLINDQVNIFIDRNESINFGIGTLKGYLIVEWADAEFPSGKKTRSFDFTIGKVIVGEGLDIITG